MKPPHISLVVTALSAAFVFGGPVWGQDAASETYTPKVGQTGKDVIWVPTPQMLVDRMLDMAGLKPDDRLVDLGSGDGRTVITAAKRGATARGIEFNPEMVTLAQRAAKAEGVADRATFVHGDIFESDFSDATVVTLFLLPSLNVRLRPILLDMPPGTRIVSNSFTMGDWQPDASEEVTGDCGSWCVAYKWIVPAKASGTWQLGDKDLVLAQNFQALEGSLRSNGAISTIRDARLDGTDIFFTVDGQRYAGKVNGNEMRGTINGGTTWIANRRPSS